MNRKGFTLVEVIAVVALLAILIGLAGTSFVKKYNESKLEALVIQEGQLVQSGDMVVRDYCKDPLSEGYQLQCEKYYQTHTDSNNKLVVENNLYTKYICVKDLKNLGYYSEELRYSGVDCSGVVVYKIDETTDLQKESFSVIRCGEDYVSNVANAQTYIDNFSKCFDTVETNEPTEQIKEYTLTINFTESTPNGVKVAQSYTKKYKKGDSVSVNVPSYATDENSFKPFKHGSSVNSSNFSLNANKTKITGTMPEKDVIINIVYSVATYTLTINYKEYNNVQGNINYPSKQIELYFGEETTLPYETKDNFKVISPTDLKFQMQKEDVSIDVIYQQQDFTLTYNSNGGTSCTTRKVTYNKAFGTLCTPTRTGYNFKGWKLADGTTINENTINQTYSNVSLNAIWEAKKYIVTYHMGDGETTAGSKVIGTSECYYGQECTLKSFSSFNVAFPYSDYDGNSDGNADYGWNYSGWTNYEDTMEIKYTDSQTLTYNKAYNLDLYAIGEKNLILYGGNSPSTSYAKLKQYWNPYQNSETYLSNVTFPEAKEISGWTFIGYKDGQSVVSDGKGGTVPGITESNKINKSLPQTSSSVTVKPGVRTCVSIRSVYQRNISIVYNANNGTSTLSNETAKQYYNSGIGHHSNPRLANIITSLTVTLPSTGVSRTGYTFNGWLDGSTSGTLKAANSSYTFTPGVTDSNSKTMYASWEGNKYAVVYSCNGGTPTSSYTSEHTYDVSKKLTKNQCVKSGSYFSGWKDSNGNVYSDEQNVKNLVTDNNSSITLTAQWSPITYTISFAANGGSGTMSNMTVSYGQVVTLTSNTFTKTGHRFDGWSGSNGTNYADKASVSNLASTNGSTITMTARWTKCAAGTYLVNNVCTNCSAGTYSSEGAGSCSNCTAGYYCPGSSNRIACPSGYTSASGATAQSSCYISVSAGKYIASAGTSTQTSCAAGTSKAAHTVYYGNTSSCSNCTAGTYSLEGASGCTNCEAGKYSDAKSSTCTACPQGYQCPGGTDKIACSAGTYTNATGKSSCSTCSAGTYNTGTGNTSCKTCEIGYYCSGGASKVTCPSGYTSAAGATAQSNCYISVGAGKYIASSGASSPTNCAAGKYKAAHTVNYGSTSSCSSCAAGQYSAEGAGSCSNCAAGTYNTGTGNSGCTTCEAGYYCTGGTARTACPAGKYRSSTGGTSSSSCTACATGSYTSSTGSTSCTPCQGKTTSGTGQTSCNASCSNSSNVSTWNTTTWSSNTVSNLCSVKTCSSGYSVSSNACVTSIPGQLIKFSGSYWSWKSGGTCTNSNTCGTGSCQTVGTATTEVYVVSISGSVVQAWLYEGHIGSVGAGGNCVRGNCASVCQTTTFETKVIDGKTYVKVQLIDTNNVFRNAFSG